MLQQGTFCGLVTLSLVGQFSHTPTELVGAVRNTEGVAGQVLASGAF
jgi:hypothetical protein